MGNVEGEKVYEAGDVCTVCLNNLPCNKSY